MATMGEIVIGLIIVSVVYSLGITLMTWYIPNNNVNQFVLSSDGLGTSNASSFEGQTKTSIQSLTQLPIQDNFGSLVFYSTNIALNFIVNAFIAVPSLLSTLVSGIFFFIPVDNVAYAQTKIAFLAIFTILFYLALFFYILGSRAPQPYGVVR